MRYLVGILIALVLGCGAAPQTTPPIAAHATTSDDRADLEKRTKAIEAQLSRDREAVLVLGRYIDELQSRTARLDPTLVRWPSAQSEAESTIDDNHEANR